MTPLPPFLNGHCFGETRSHTGNSTSRGARPGRCGGQPNDNRTSTLPVNLLCFSAECPNRISSARPFKPYLFCHFKKFIVHYSRVIRPQNVGAVLQGLSRALCLNIMVCLTMSESLSKRSASTSSDSATCSSIRGISRSMRSNGAANGDLDGICHENHQHSYAVHGLCRQAVAVKGSVGDLALQWQKAKAAKSSGWSVVSTKLASDVPRPSCIYG